LWGNAIGALRHIGLADAVLARAETMQITDFLLADGRRLSRMGASELTGKGLEPFALVHRAELLEVLLDQLPADVVHFGSTFVSCDEDATRRTLTAHFAGGKQEGGDVLIGADGLKSAVRARMFGTSPPRYSGYTCWRGVVPFPEDRVPPGYVAEVWGRGARFGIVRIGGGRVYWWATLNAPMSRMEQSVLDEDAKTTLLKSHGAFCDPVPALIQATDETQIIRNDIFDRDPIRNWSRRRVLLIGDAAHPTTPNLGQGGCMAIEDGVTLPYFLKGLNPRDTAAIADRLDKFVEFRYAKTREVVLQSRWFGAIAQWESGFLCAGRDAVMRAIAPLSMKISAKRIGRFREPG